MHICNVCDDTSDAVPLSPPQRLYLKPIARLNVSVQLPQLKVPDKSISSWEVMEKLRKMIKPDKFSSLKVTKSTLDIIRFEAEVGAKSKLPGLVTKLDCKTIKLSGFSELLKVRAAEAKIPFPTRHVWDSYFREAKHMNEMKPGERPDTIHICNLPCKWFMLKEYQDDPDVKPSEYIFRKVFETFGEVRYVDVPCTDPYRKRMKHYKATSGINTFSFDEGHIFEGYVQYKEYMSFLKAMTALKGMQLLYKDTEKSWTANIKVDFDQTKHMTDQSIRRRHVERERLIQQDAQLLDKERKIKEAKEAEIQKKVMEQKQEQERQKQAELEDAEKKHKQVERRLAKKERKLQEAKQKLENINFMSMLLKNSKMKQLLKKASKEKKKKKKKREIPEKVVITQTVVQENEEDRELLLTRELELRQRLLLKYKEALDKELAVDEEQPSTLVVDVEQPSTSTERPDTTATVEGDEQQTAVDSDTTENKKIEESETQENVAESTTSDVKETPEVEEPKITKASEPVVVCEIFNSESSSEEEEIEQHANESSDDAITISASQASLKSSSDTESDQTESEEEKKHSKKRKKKKEKKKEEKKKKHKKRKKAKKEKKKEKKSKKHNKSSSEELEKELEPAPGPSGYVQSKVQVWRGRGSWRGGHFPRPWGRGRGGGGPMWFPQQEFYDPCFIPPPPWNHHPRGGGGFMLFPPGPGFTQHNFRRPYFRHHAPQNFYDKGLTEAYEKYFLKFAHREDVNERRHDSRSSSRSSSRSRRRSRSRSRSYRSKSRSRSSSRSYRRNHRRSRSKSRSSSRSKSRSRSRSRSRHRHRTRSRSHSTSHSRSRSRDRK